MSFPLTPAARRGTGRSALIVCVFLWLVALPLPGLRAQVGAAQSGAMGTFDDQVRRYLKAISDAEKIRAPRIASNLTLISPTNLKLQWKDKCVLMVTVVNAGKYKVGDTISASYEYPVWVTAAPDLREWFRTHPYRGTGAALRLRQLMGLPPDGFKAQVVEMWVPASLLLRPALDPSITSAPSMATITQAATYCFTPVFTNVPFTPFQQARYSAWFYKQCAQSYSLGLSDMGCYPWTRLGYTYDWGADDVFHQGLSEFIIMPLDSDAEDKTTIVKSVTDVDAYLSGQSAP